MVPMILHPEIEGSRYFAGNSKSLVIQGDSSRSRTDNMQECYRKLHNLILEAGKSTIRGETSQTQVERVKKLFVIHLDISEMSWHAQLTPLLCRQHKENEMRLRGKKNHGNKKAARKGFSKGSNY